MDINIKRRLLKNSHSTQLIQANVSGHEGIPSHPLTDRIGFHIGSSAQANKYFVDSFYTQRESRINEPRKKRNLGITLSKIELPDRLVKQKELFNEMGGWLKSASKERELISSQNSSKKFLRNKLTTTMNQFNPNSSQTSSFTHADTFQQEKKKPNFYEHQNIFRVKDFKQLKNKDDIIAKSVDDPISIVQRRILIQEFEIKVQQFLRILKFKKELGSKAYSKFYKTVEQSFGGLNSFNFNVRQNSQSLHQTSQNQNTLIKNSLNNTQNGFNSKNEYNNRDNELNLNENLQGNSGFINSDQANGNFSNFENVLNKGSNNGSISDRLESHSTNLQRNNKNTMSYPIQKDQIIQSLPQTKRLMQRIQNQQNNSVQQLIQGDISSNISQFSQYQQSGQKHGSFIDRNKDIEWQYNTYYQINQHQFQELSEKQLNYLTAEEKDQYFVVLDHFKSVGHRFQVQVVVTERSDYNLQTLATDGDENYGNAPNSSIQKQRKQIQTSHSTSRLALHQRLQDYILDQCKNYLNSDDTDYDEKLRVMKKQYEQMLDNFEKKSHKVWLPKNVRPRNQDFNDYYIYDDSANLNKYQSQIFQDITQENFGSILSINMDLVKDEYPMQIEEEKEVLDEQEIDQEKEEEENKDMQQDMDEDDDEEYSDYEETPYSQRKLRNQKKVIKVPDVNSPAHFRPPKKNQEQKQKKKQDLNIQIEKSPKQKIASPSLKSEKGDDSDSSFNKSINKRHLSQQLTSSIENSPYVRSKHSQSVAHRSIKNSPRSNKAASVLDSEDEDKFDDQQLPPKKNQGRSQFSKKAPTSSGNPSKILISINDIKSEKSGSSTPKNEEEKQEEIEEAGPKSLESVEALSLTPENSSKRNRIQKKLTEDGFEQAHDYLEELKDINPKDNIQQKNNNQNKSAKNSDDISFDLGSNKNSSRKIRGPGEKKDNKDGLKRENSLQRNNSGSNIRINNNPAGAVSSFKQKIVNEIKMEEERNKVQEQEMETVILGTGLFDRVLSTNSYLDLDYNKYFKHYKRAPPINPHLQHKTDFDKQIYIKMSQWEYELNEDNENYGLSLDNIVESLLQVQMGIAESKNKNKKSTKTTHSNIAQNSSQSIQQHKNSLNDSIIEGQDISSQNQGDTSFFRDVSASIGNQLNRVQSLQAQAGHSRTPSQYASGSNSPFNRSQILIQDSQRSISNKENPTLKHNQSSFQEAQLRSKKQSSSPYNQEQSQNDNHHKSKKQMSMSSESEDSQKPSSKSSIGELEDIKLPQKIPSVSDCSDFD